MLGYLFCEYLGFSGPIATVLCGLYYATGIAGLERKNGNQKFEDIHDLFYSFWDVTDNLLNGILFLLIGLLFVDVVNFNEFFFMGIGVIAFGSIIINTISRVAGVFINAVITEKLPLDISKLRFTIFSHGQVVKVACVWH